MSGEQKDRIMCQGAFVTTGTYQVWVRGYAPNGAGDSLYVKLGQQPAMVLTGFDPQQWSWGNKRINDVGPVTIEITQPGIHTLHLWQREDGVRLDRIVLTTDINYNPLGNGPNESQRLDSSK